MRKNIASSKTAIAIHISDAMVSNEKRVKLLEINLEERLNFDFYVDTPIKKASKKCYALARVSNYMDSNKRCVLMNAFKILVLIMSARMNVPY